MTTNNEHDALAFTPSLREYLSFGKYTHGWVETLTEEQVFGLLWLVGEVGARRSLTCGTDRSTAPRRRAIACHNALLEFSWHPLTDTKVREMIRAAMAEIPKPKAPEDAFVSAIAAQARELCAAPPPLPTPRRLPPLDADEILKAAGGYGGVTVHAAVRALVDAINAHERDAVDVADGTF